MSEQALSSLPDASTDILHGLRAILGPKGLLTDRDEMAPFLEDWRGRKTGDALAIALPASTEEASAVVKSVTQAGLPVFPQGGNTGLCYGAVPGHGGRGNSLGIVVSTKRMNRIRQVDKVANLMTVDAGCVLANIHEASEDIDRQFPLYLGSEGSAQIGGLISTNAGGTGVVRYGTTRSLIAGLEVVMPDGRVFSNLTGLQKDNTGYDLKHCFIGGEGTIGLITGATLKLSPTNKAEAHAWVAADSPEAALEILNRLQNSCAPYILAFELLSASEIQGVKTFIPAARIPFDEIPEWNVMIELGSPDAEVDLQSRLEAVLTDCLEQGIVEDAFLAQNKAQADSIWHVRHSESESNKLTGVGVVSDVSVRVSDVPTFIRKAEAVCASRFSEANPHVVCHYGDGNVHYIAMYPHDYWRALGSEEARDQKSEEVLTALHDIASELGGSFSSEHGIGRKLTHELVRLSDPLRFELMLSLKKTFDPQNLFNPGILFEQFE